MNRPTGVLFTTALATLALSASAQAVVINVDTPADDAGGGMCNDAVAADCSVRSAIDRANATGGLDEIKLPPGTFAVNDVLPTHGLPTLTEEATISGSGARNTTIEGAGVAQQLLRLDDAGGSFTVRDMTLRGAKAAEGAAVRGTDGDVVAQRVAIVDNAQLGIGANESLTIDDSLVARNRGEAVAGVIGAQIVTVRNSTIAGNTTIDDPAIPIPVAYGAGLVTGCLAVVEGSTIAGNRIDSGLPAIGGANVSVVAMGPGCPSLARVRNSVIAGGGAAGNCSDNVQSIGHNVDSDGTCHFDLASDRSGADPKLAALADNGGPTDTIALREGSPAIDLGADCSANDQRGIAHTLGGGCDAGAFESPFTAPIPAAPAPAAAPAPVTTTVTVAPPADATPAKLTLSGIGSSVKRAALNKGLKVKVAANEPVAIDATLALAPRRVTIARNYDLTVATASLARAAGTRTLTLKPRRKVSGKRKVYALLRIVAIDAGGNHTVVQKAITVK